MKGLQEQLRRLLNQGDIINPKNSTPAGENGEQKVIVPLVFNLEPEKQAVVLDENGKIVESDAPRVQYSKLIKEHDYINPGAHKAGDRDSSIIPENVNLIEANKLVVDKLQNSQLRNKPFIKIRRP